MVSITRAIVIKGGDNVAENIPGSLAIEDRALPDVGENEVRIRALLLSLDPAQVMWIAGRSPYMPVRPGDVLPCSQIGIVEESRVSGISAGDTVSCFASMAERSVVRSLGFAHDAGTGGTLAVTPINPDPATQLELHLSLLSHIGVTGISGMRQTAKVRAGETVLVSGAAGATGSIAAQIARIDGARVIGIAGGPEKCATLTSELGLDAAIDHRSDVDEQLSRLAPNGVDVFFDTVGAKLLDTGMMHMAPRGRIIICGSTADYGKAQGETYRMANIGQLLQRNVSMIPFWVSDNDAHLAQNLRDLRNLYLSGRLRVMPAHMLNGLDAVPEGLDLLLTGGNRGKLIVRME